MLNIIFLIVLIGGFIYFQKSIEKSESNRLKLGKYAIGSFIIFNNQLGRSYINKYEYFFYDDSGNKYYRGDSKKLPKGNFRKNIIEGDQFLVIYDEDGSDIYFDYPIKDSIDFRRYVKEFEEMRKQKK